MPNILKQQEGAADAQWLDAASLAARYAGSLGMDRQR
jgi:hypothetical protein